MNGESQDEGEKQQRGCRRRREEGLGEREAERQRKGRRRKSRRLVIWRVPDHGRLPALNFRTKPEGFSGKSPLLSSPAFWGVPEPS